jgi:GGDEF domain-containing protein
MEGFIALWFFKVLNISEDNFKYINYIGFGILVLITLITIAHKIYSIFKQNRIIKLSLQSSKSFTFELTRKNKIVYCSELLANEFGIKEKEIFGYDFFYLLEKSVRIITLNGSDSNLPAFKSYFTQNRKKQRKEADEIYYLNSKGDKKILKITFIPIVILGIYFGQQAVGEVILDMDTLKNNKTIATFNSQIMNFQTRLFSLIELTNDVCFFANLKKNTIWFSELGVDSLNLGDNELSVAKFQNKIEPTDLNKCIAQWNNLTEQNPSYSIKYRLLIKGSYIWIQEKGKLLLEEDHTNIIVGTMKIIQTNHFMSTGIDLLDKIPSTDAALVKINSMLRENRRFEIIILRVANLPEINEKHSRSVGNMALGSYISHIHSLFCDDDMIYRLAGLDFLLIITDVKKMTTIKSFSDAKENPFDHTFTYGAIQISLSVKAGIILSTEQDSEEELVGGCYKALKMVSSPIATVSVCYYRDIK